MSTIFKANESYREQEIKMHRDDIGNAEKKHSSLEEKYVMNEIERDSCAFMKPMLIGSSYPGNLIIKKASVEPLVRKVILVLTGFEQDSKKERPRNFRSFQHGSPKQSNNEPALILILPHFRISGFKNPIRPNMGTCDQNLVI